MNSATGTPGRTRSTVVRFVATAVLGAMLLIVPTVVLLTAADVVQHQHWSYGALLGVAAACGVLLVAAVVRDVREGDRPRRDVAHPVRRVVGATVLSIALVGTLGAAWWLEPFGATDRALDALGSDETVTVAETSGWYSFTPVGSASEVGLVYSPGARVDVRATAAILRPLAEAGYTVVSLKEPLGIAFVDIDQSADAIEAHPDVETWVVGGHSLGGVAASSFAGANPETVDGLLLHASYPAGDISDSPLTVTSVSGSEDGLSTPEAIADSRQDLPAATTFVEIAGAVHADFADYGPQPGDGAPTISRDDAQAQIVEASLALLDGLDHQP
ncbi:alpha/beta hydrolase [Paraoerskovia marina]|uniref:alpha/beta hydrolase n=1 Tax=Paraoerskovia marina TaxID=545619 RepID=UPI000492B1D6|nr:alpha/beta hydrolase [Paraoerskovia marina]